MDIKHMDDTRHRELTGVSNQLILNNARRIAQVCPLILRIPVVPGCNDTEENIKATAEFASTLGDNLLRIELLPYHNLGSQTYEKMGRDYLLKEVETPSGEQMDRLRQIAELSGVKIEVAGS